MAAKFLLKFLSLPLRLLAFILAVYVVAATGYHIQRLNSNDLSPSPELYAIIVIAGVAALYAGFTALAACFFPRGGFILFFILDLIFCGGFIAISVLLRGAVTKPRCADGLWTKSGGSTYDKGLKETCAVDKAAFAVSVANAVFFALLALFSLLIHRHNKRNRAFGPGPDNGYSVHGGEKPARKKSIWGRTRHSQPVGTAVNPAAGYEPDDGRYTREYRGGAPVTAGGAGGVRHSMGTDSEDGFARRGGAGGFDPELAHSKRESVGLGGQPTRGYDAF